MYTKEQILLMMHSEDRNERSRAVTASYVYEYSDPEINEGIVALLSDPSLEVRESAVNAVAEHGLSEAIPILSGNISHQEPLFRLANAKALKQTLDNLSYERLNEYRYTNDPWIAHLACLILWERGVRDNMVSQTLERLSHHPSITSAPRASSTEIEELWEHLLWTGNSHL